MRKVAWDRGPVRLGTLRKESGAQAPMWHDSEVAAVAYAIEKILERRAAGAGDAAPDAFAKQDKDSDIAFTQTLMAGKKCSECGAHALIKKDGCEFCTNCGHVGACG